MRRLALTTLLLALALPAGARAEAADPPQLEADVTSCVTGLDAASRSATFSGSMPAIPGSSVLAMRFDLERFSGTSWKPVTASTLGRWERSVPGAAGFLYDKGVERLPAPATYRAIVRFRWYSSSGRVLREVQRKSPVCRQPERRPDLAPTVITPGVADADGATTYDVVVHNSGVTDVLRPFRLQLSVGGVALAPQALAGLPAAQSATVTFTGPACRPGDALRAAVDQSDAVDEADEADNELVQRCVAG